MIFRSLKVLAITTNDHEMSLTRAAIGNPVAFDFIVVNDYWGGGDAIRMAARAAQGARSIPTPPSRSRPSICWKLWPPWHGSVGGGDVDPPLHVRLGISLLLPAALIDLRHEAISVFDDSGRLFDIGLSGRASPPAACRRPGNHCITLPPPRAGPRCYSHCHHPFILRGSGASVCLIVWHAPLDGYQ